MPIPDRIERHGLLIAVGNDELLVNDRPVGLHPLQAVFVVDISSRLGFVVGDIGVVGVSGDVLRRVHREAVTGSFHDPIDEFSRKLLREVVRAHSTVDGDLVREERNPPDVDNTSGVRGGVVGAVVIDDDIDWRLLISRIARVASSRVRGDGGGRFPRRLEPAECLRDLRVRARRPLRRTIVDYVPAEIRRPGGTVLRQAREIGRIHDSLSEVRLPARVRGGPRFPREDEVDGRILQRGRICDRAVHNRIRGSPAGVAPPVNNLRSQGGVEGDRHHLALFQTFKSGANRPFRSLLTAGFQFRRATELRKGEHDRPFIINSCQISCLPATTGAGSGSPTSRPNRRRFRKRLSLPRHIHDRAVPTVRDRSRADFDENDVDEPSKIARDEPRVGSGGW